MKRMHYKSVRKINNYTKANISEALAEIDKRRQAFEKEEKMNSVEYKTGFEKRKCIQPLNDLEKAYKKQCEDAANLNIEESRQNLLRGIDKAAANTVGRIMAEIKQSYLQSNGLKLKDIIKVNLSVDEFYADFENFCNKNFANYTVDEQEFEKILKSYKTLNFTRISQLSDKLGYTKAIDKLNENVDIIAKFAIKENALSL